MREREMGDVGGRGAGRLGEATGVCQPVGGCVFGGREGKGKMSESQWMIVFYPQTDVVCGLGGALHLEGAAA